MKKKSNDDNLSRTAWLKKGYVVRKNAPGELVWYHKIHDYIILYPRNQVIHRQDWAKAQMNAKRKEQNKKRRDRYVCQKAKKELQKRRFYVVSMSLKSSYDSITYWSSQSYDFVADSKEQFDSITVGDELQVRTYYGWTDGRVTGKTFMPLHYQGNELEYVYRYLSGKIVTPYTEAELEDATNKIKRKMNKRRKRKKKAG